MATWWDADSRASLSRPQHRRRCRASSSRACLANCRPVSATKPRFWPPISHGPASPGYFEVLANSINIMQDHITRTRLAGEPPHVMLLPRLRQIGLMEFSRAREAIAEGRLCVEQALPMIRRLV